MEIVVGIGEANFKCIHQQGHISLRTQGQFVELGWGSELGVWGRSFCREITYRESRDTLVNFQGWSCGILSELSCSNLGSGLTGYLRSH